MKKVSRGIEESTAVHHMQVVPPEVDHGQDLRYENPFTRPIIMIFWTKVLGQMIIHESNFGDLLRPPCAVVAKAVVKGQVSWLQGVPSHCKGNGDNQEVRNTKTRQGHFQDFDHLWDFAVLVLRHLV